MTVSIPPYGKRWRVYILLQYLIYIAKRHIEKPSFFKIRPCTNSIVYAGFDVFRSFLCVFMSVVGVFVCYELWVKEPVAFISGKVDCSDEKGPLEVLLPLDKNLMSILIYFIDFGKFCDGLHFYCPIKSTRTKLREV